MSRSTLTEWKSSLPRWPILVGWIGLGLVLLWTYSSELAVIVRIWWREPDYGHCFLVPVFSAVLLWLRRDMLDPLPTRGTWWAAPFLALCAVLWWASAYFSYQKTIPLSLIPLLAGITLFLGGWRAARWAWPSIVFLVFMVPIPETYQGLLRHPLQKVGTFASVYLIQTLGIPAMAQGNVIKLENAELGVVEACSGLRMLMLFFAVCVGAAFILKRPAWEKAVIVVSAVPIAVFANVFRLTLTAFLHHLEFGKLADKVFHDMAGLMMMPVAMALLWGEMVLMSKLQVAPVSEGPLSLGGSLAKPSGTGDSQTQR